MKRIALTGLIVAATCLAMPAWSAGDAATGQQKSGICTACHGADGNSAAPTFPKLAGLGEAYLVKQLHEFRRGETRKDPSMAPMVANLSDQDIADIAAFYASRERSFSVASEELVERGEAIYRGGISGSSVGACIGCHGPRGAGNPAAKFPAVSGQHAQYLAAQLMKFRSGERSNDPNRMMRNIANRMTDAEIQAVTSYMAGLY
ncbi:MAG: cytochrome c4 [Gammaproteobacteria bacterium]|nr:cytochrome c4 [Gammaproteobacteria bacterium]